MPDEAGALPDLTELRQDVSTEGTGPPTSLQQGFQQQTIDSQTLQIHATGLRQHYSHKVAWSVFLMVMMAAMIGFQSFLLYKVGGAEWNFSAYDWLLQGLLVQNLAQIAGLCVIVVKALFRDPVAWPTAPPPTT